MNKRFLLFLIFFLSASFISAQDLKGVKVLINPGHGGHDSDDRHILETDFWESEGNLSKGLYLRDILQNLGATVIMSRTENNTSDDLALSAIVAMANDNNVQYMHAIHSNAAGGNYTLMLYQGTTATPTYPDSKVMSQLIGNEIYGAHRTTDLRLAGDFDFYGTGKPYLGVFKGLNMPGSLSEGSFHDYIPESWRLKNQAYLKHEAWAIAKAFLAFWGRPSLKTGILAGIVRNPEEVVTYSTLTSADVNKPVNNIKITLKPLDPSNTTGLKVYNGDGYNNGFFMFDELIPGPYRVIYQADGYLRDSSDVTVLASKNVFADKFLYSSLPATVSVTSPAGDSLYPGLQNIILEFSRSMNTASVQSAISLSPSAPLSFTWSGDKKLTVSTSALTFNSAYTLTISGTAQAKYQAVTIDGNKDGIQGDNFNYSFRTKSKDLSAPYVEAIFPSDKMENVELIPLINLSFSELLNTSTITTNVKLVKTAGQAFVSSTVKYYNLSNGKTVVSLFPGSPLQPDENYSIIVTAGVQDQFGNPTASDMVYTFKTAGESYTVTLIDNFESGLATNWTNPATTAPFSGLIASETNMVSNYTYTNRFTGSRVSMQFLYSWDTKASNWFARTALTTGTPRNVTFTAQNVLQTYVFGDGSGNKFRFCVADGTNFAGREVSPWFTIDWTGWKLVSWDMTHDGLGTWPENTTENGVLDGQLRFDSFQFTYTPGSPSSGSICFDDLRSSTKPYVGVEKEVSSTKPADYVLNQNYPNPFNPSTSLSYQIPENSFVSLKVYDLLGREVATLVDAEQTAGRYKVEFNAGNIPSGIYIYMLRTDNFKEIKKMMLLK